MIVHLKLINKSVEKSENRERSVDRMVGFFKPSCEQFSMIIIGAKF